MYVGDLCWECCHVCPTCLSHQGRFIQQLMIKFPINVNKYTINVVYFLLWVQKQFDVYGLKPTLAYSMYMLTKQSSIFTKIRIKSRIYRIKTKFLPLIRFMFSIMIFQNHEVLEYYRFYQLHINHFPLNKHVNDYKDSFLNIRKYETTTSWYKQQWIKNRLRYGKLDHTRSGPLN